MEGTNPLMESEEAFPSQAAFESLAKRRGSEKRIRKGFRDPLFSCSDPESLKSRSRWGPTVPIFYTLPSLS